MALQNFVKLLVVRNRNSGSISTQLIYELRDLFSQILIERSALAGFNFDTVNFVLIFLNQPLNFFKHLNLCFIQFTNSYAEEGG